MLKRVISLSLATFFISLAISPIFGFHGHDDNGLLSIHTHEQNISKDSHFIKHDTYSHIESPHIEDDHPDTHSGSISILIYLLGQKINLNASILSILPVKYFSSSNVIDNNKKLINTPIFIQFLCNNQIASLTNRITSCYVAARAPPFYS